MRKNSSDDNLGVKFSLCSLIGKHSRLVWLHQEMLLGRELAESFGKLKRGQPYRRTKMPE